MHPLTTSTIGWLALCAATLAQDFEPASATQVRFDDGSGELMWKAQNPSGPGDWFNVDFDSALDGVSMVALYCDVAETMGVAGSHARLGVYPESSVFPHAPDTTAPVVERTSLVVRALDPCAGNSRFDGNLRLTNAWLAKATVPTGDHHVAVQFTPGDSHSWLCADTSSATTGRSYFGVQDYATGAVPFSANWMLGVGQYEVTTPGTLLVNGATSATVPMDGGQLCVTFFGPTLSTPSVLYFCWAGAPFLRALPASITITDGAFAGPCPMTWQLCTTLDCNTPTTSGVEFCSVYLDFADLKPDGRPKTKIGSSVNLAIEADQRCLPCGGLSTCFGRRDDCVMDATIWRVQNPAGPSDWFNVNHGMAPELSDDGDDCADPIESLIGVSMSSWDFGGFGPCWTEVGIYPANTALDPSGATPDIANPLASVRGSSACMPANAGDWGCPMTFYDTPDVPANLTTVYHVAARWMPGDSVTWLGSDSDGVDSPCGLALPNNGLTSLMSSDSYATPPIPMTTANWMMQLKWN